MTVTVATPLFVSRPLRNTLVQPAVTWTSVLSEEAHVMRMEIAALLADGPFKRGGE